MEKFQSFLNDNDSLHVYYDNNLIYSSKKDGLLPLLEYIQNNNSINNPVIIFDKIAGNAAALLAIKAGCNKIYSPLASQLAINTLNKYDIKYHFLHVIPYIQKIGHTDICPMEKLSLNKEPEEFYKLITKYLNKD